ncbi:MAG: glycosyltransferase family 4 protein [Burkholderiales bacterium]|nr:glycosyltransferase family 4 protein [Burkholderiales bacterium]
MKIALISTGLGRVLRGFESFTESLFQALRHRASEVDVTLFQGGGQAGEQRDIVPNLHRADVPSRWFGPDTASLLEKRSFALALYPRLRTGGYDVVHYNELTMGSALFHLRRRLGGQFKLLYCNGAPSPPIHFHHRCDFTQVLTGPDYAAAREFGIADSRLFPIPYGIDADTFSPARRTSHNFTRDELGVPRDALMVLSVAAVKREHKRIDHLIEETARLGPHVWLVVAGQRTDDTPGLEQLAEQRMPGRWRFVSWPHARVAELYGAADLFVLCSLTEAFGLVTVEAMLSELPVIVHDGPVFQWLAQGTAAHVIDMASPGALSHALGEVFAAGAASGLHSALRRTREVARQRFSWESLMPQYLEMYHQVSNPKPHRGV